MIDTLIKAFTTGDIAELKTKLLHSTCWSQHNAKAYGQDKLQAQVLSWLALTGRCQVINQTCISQGEQQLIHLTLQPQNSDKTVDYCFWLETNGQVIKSVYAIVDTLQLAFATSQTTDVIMQALPQPDAFVLQDYDQQDHLQADLAKPSNITQLTIEDGNLLDAWWAIWSEAQLANIDNLYQANAKIALPGATSNCNKQEFFDFVLHKHSGLTRVFCQLQQIIVDGQQVAVKWFMDGDENGHRIRVPYISLLTLNHGKISFDQTSSDILAHVKRFQESRYFNG